MVVRPTCALPTSMLHLTCCIFNILILAREQTGHSSSLSDGRKRHRAKSDPAETRWELWGAAQDGGTPQYQSTFLSPWHDELLLMISMTAVLCCGACVCVNVCELLHVGVSCEISKCSWELPEVTLLSLLTKNTAQWFTFLCNLMQWLEQSLHCSFSL